MVHHHHHHSDLPWCVWETKPKVWEGGILWSRFVAAATRILCRYDIIKDKTPSSCLNPQYMKCVVAKHVTLILAFLKKIKKVIVLEAIYIYWNLSPVFFLFLGPGPSISGSEDRKEIHYYNLVLELNSN